MKNRSKSVSNNNNWSTPKGLYESLVWYFALDETFDPCPMENDIALFDGLTADWVHGTFCNPPYTQALKTAFVKKGLWECRNNGHNVLFLLPVSTSTKLFQETILPNAAQILFFDKRLKFEGINSKGQWANPGNGRQSPRNPPVETVVSSGGHDSMLVWFEQKYLGAQKISRYYVG
jgi:hypothetical protein